ncbi:hypothetical protein BG74_04300 [Sodalis-like endosymbiont of Proechinophthirus fluctus]|uniref:hypothetical protein n=1 Tax=Sodalis-like endosymbiont of Proechinophthirus fluctus TaxID=1462730 RepID=UPI0007A83F40|nr:hypothetical protein [Sodalis-like endosymbiont of Proechinophthirus fluctus]KYP97300.1 hypothetical protein BG74_04300 [Sodalis-like endosymbiont of Proechinophthirus fluctus]
MELLESLALVDTYQMKLGMDSARSAATAGQRQRGAVFHPFYRRIDTEIVVGHSRAGTISYMKHDLHGEPQSKTAVVQKSKLCETADSVLEGRFYTNTYLYYRQYPRARILKRVR